MNNNYITYINQALGDGSVWNAKSKTGSNLSNLVLVLSSVLQKIRQNTDNAKTEQDIYKTTLSNISNWEHLLGIPDDVFTQTTQLTLDERIRQVILKLVGFRKMTKTNLLNSIYNIFGVNFEIKILTRADTTKFNNIKLGYFKFTDEVEGYAEIVIRLSKSLIGQSGFPFTFPITFGKTSNKTLIENFIIACVPFNKKVSFEYVL